MKVHVTGIQPADADATKRRDTRQYKKTDSSAIQCDACGSFSSSITFLVHTILTFFSHVFCGISPKNRIKMKLAILSATIGAACAFAPSASNGVSSALRMSEPVTEEAAAVNDSPVVEEEPAAPAVAPLNGWVPDASLPCYGLPGASAPLGFFDPLGFTKDMDLNGVKRLREAEVMHGRVAMMATVGYLIGESTPTITYGMNVHHTIANNQIPEVPGTVLFPFFLAINIAEALRASIGWVEPGLGPLFSLRESYYPGDISFDPLGLKPKEAKDFANMQTKELNNGRLAMLAAAGMCVQEQVNGKGILENLGF